MESGALRHWTRVEGAEDPLREPVQERRPGQGQAQGSGQASAGSGNSWGPDSEDPPAITAQDPRTQPSYPWQKAPRTEETTT